MDQWQLLEVQDAPKQGTEEWLAWRKTGITATEAGSIVFPDTHNSPMTVYSNKLGLTKSDQSDPDGFMEWGHRIEDLLVAKFMENHPTFHSVEQGKLYARDWAKCSLDAQCLTEDGTPAIIECKTGQNEAKWSPYPDRYYAQVQWQMYVTGIRKAYFSVLIRGHHYFEREVDFNAEFVVAMFEKCKYVWESIQSRTPPAKLGFFAADKDAISAIAGEHGHTGAPQEVDKELALKYCELSERYAKAEAELAAVKNELMYKMVDVERLTFDGKPFASWVERKGSATIDKAKLQKKFPEAYEECLKVGKGTRYVRFTV